MGPSSQPQRAIRLRNNTPRTIFLDGSTCICTGQRWTLPQVGSAFGANPGALRFIRAYRLPPGLPAFLWFGLVFRRAAAVRTTGVMRSGGAIRTAGVYHSRPAVCRVRSGSKCSACCRTSGNWVAVVVLLGWRSLLCWRWRLRRWRLFHRWRLLLGWGRLRSRSRRHRNHDGQCRHKRYECS